MASTLTGLVRALAWSDFPRKKGNPPGPDESIDAAFTQTAFNISGPTSQPVAGTTQFQIADDLKVIVTFDRNTSYVMSWLFDKAKEDQANLLKHEQGHYNITALCCRDFFVDALLLKGQKFASGGDVDSAVSDLNTQMRSDSDKIQALYDDEVRPEQDSGKTRGPIQRSWDGFIQTAFSQPRSTGTKGPDGTPDKVRLIDVLTQNGRRL